MRGLRVIGCGLLAALAVALVSVGVSAHPAAAAPARAASAPAKAAATPAVVSNTPTTDGATYRMVASDGGIFSFGGSTFYGSAGGLPLARPVVAMASTTDGGGYWTVASDGGMFNYGDARFFGSLGATRIPAPIVGLAATPDGGGYWMVGADGSVYPFGDAAGFGNLTGKRLNKPIVAMAATPDGNGYWLVAADGGVFAYGDARFFGSTGNLTLRQPIVSMASTPDGAGYWMVASDGGVFAYGDAAFYGSTGNLTLRQPVVGLAPLPDGQGYWLVASDGGVFAYGAAGFEGSLGDITLARPVVGVAMSTGRTGTAAYDACPANNQPLPGAGPSVAEAVAIPALAPTAIPGAPPSFNATPAEVPDAFLGTLFEPQPGAYSGRRPAVALFHGISGDQCQVWWLARYLAGKGYVTLTLTSPTPNVATNSYGVAITAARAAVAYLTTPTENPFTPVTDPTSLGLAGWSEGSVVASMAQGLPGMGAVKAIVAMDNLRGSFQGDSGAPVTYCVPPTAGTVNPVVPALGFADDQVCPQQPNSNGSGIKQSGFSRWVAAGLPAVELPLAGYNHFDFSQAGSKLTPVGQLSLSWFQAWLAGQPSALSDFQSCQLPPLLSTAFDSGAHLPSLGVNSTTYRQDLSTSCAVSAG